MRALMGQYQGKLTFWEMMGKMDKDFLSSHLSLRPPIHSTVPGRLGIALLEMTFPTPAWPPKKALLLIHCYYTTLQPTSKNCSIRPAHLETEPSVITLNYLHSQGGGKQLQKFKKLENKTELRWPTWGTHALAKTLVPETFKACYTIMGLHRATWWSPFRRTMTAFYKQKQLKEINPPRT